MLGVLIGTSVISLLEILMALFDLYAMQYLHRPDLTTILRPPPMEEEEEVNEDEK